MIGILDLEICNLTSVSSAIYNLGFDIKVIKIDQKNQLNEISHINGLSRRFLFKYFKRIF